MASKVESKIPVPINRNNNQQTNQQQQPASKPKNKNKKKNAAAKAAAAAAQAALSGDTKNGGTPSEKTKQEASKKDKVDGVKKTCPGPAVDDSACELNRTRTIRKLSPYSDWDSPVRNVFLWLMSGVYLFAFTSVYYQIRGLYGNNGILPLQYFASRLTTNQSMALTDLNEYAPSLVWTVAARGASLTTSMEIITLAGVLVSLLQLVFSAYRTSPFYMLQFILYFSIASVGQTFLYFQWDSFLLEVGILTFLLSLRSLDSESPLTRITPHPSLPLWSLRWLMFKFMFSSGVVKLTSRCPIWWSLRALDIHFESVCLPTPLSWFAHQIPTNWLHLAVALTYVLEIVLPFLFFTPYRSLKIFSFITQILFQVMIILTGNFNFFNVLTIVMCIPLLDDSILGKRTTSSKDNQSNSWEYLFNGLLIGLLSFYTIQYFDVSFEGQSLSTGPNTKVNFTYDQFNRFLIHAVIASFWLGLISFAIVAYYAFKRCFFGSLVGRFIHFISTLFYVFLAGIILALSIVPLTELETSGVISQKVPTGIQRMYQVANSYHLVSGYGLFRVMTGDGGRPELIIEGSNDVKTWKPYIFRYKPDDLYKAPRFNIPHQPRLDWQMWFAALGTYQENPWLVQFCYRLLEGEKDVLNLLDRNRLPFDSPPKYLRISRYLYLYTNDVGALSWWRQKSNRQDYLPVVSKETLKNALKLNEIQIPKAIQLASTDRLPKVKSVVDAIHNLVVVRLEPYIEPHYMMMLLMFLAILIRSLRKA